MTTSSRNIWPYAIVATFVLFAAYIGYMVQRAMRTNVDLVSADYYQQELAHQQRMESVARTAALPAPVQVRYEGAAQRLTVQIPASLAGQKCRAPCTSSALPTRSWTSSCPSRRPATRPNSS
ncbi:FixH family protein [Hymenobacter humi]|uniref:FixH family protein n=1 Tax=Hymenobacter humi TaxID=1411620 RepID=A0ABW2U1R1_9BACT